MTYDAFISYSRKDTVAAAAIQEQLTRAGLTCYRDETNIAGSDRWVESLTEAIENSCTIVALLSSHSVGSEHARREMHFAIHAKKPIVPILLDRELELPKVFQFYLSEIQFLFADGPLLDALPGIEQTVSRVVDRVRHQAEYVDEADVRRRATFHLELEPPARMLGLPVGDVGGGTASASGNFYVLTSRPGEFMSARMETLPAAGEFIIEARVAKPKGQDEECFGFEFGASHPGDYYQFLVTGAGDLRIARHFQGSWMDLLVKRIQRRQFQDRLKVVRRGEFAHVFVNDLCVASINDFKVRTGQLGFAAGRNLSVWFSEVKIAGVGLEAVYQGALESWAKLEAQKAKDALEYVARYDPDLHTTGWPAAKHLLREVLPDRHQSVLLVIGSSAAAQFNDGLHAEALRQEINTRGAPHPFRWAAVITDGAFLADARCASCAVIAVGGPTAYELTAKLQQQLPAIETAKDDIKIHGGAQTGIGRMALWGPLAASTRDAVDHVVASGLLEEFLKEIWSTETR